MGAGDRPLWTCPRCGHRFVTANMWHSCTRVSLDDAFARSTPDVRACFDRYVELIERCGPVVVIAQRSRIVIMDRVRFAGAVALRDRLRVNFALTRRLDRPPFRLTVYSRRWIAHTFEVRAPDELDDPELPALLCESYHDIGRQLSLRAPLSRSAIRHG